MTSVLEWDSGSRYVHLQEIKAGGNAFGKCNNPSQRTENYDIIVEPFMTGSIICWVVLEISFTECSEGIPCWKARSNTCENNNKVTIRRREDALCRNILLHRRLRIDSGSTASR